MSSYTEKRLRCYRIDNIEICFRSTGNLTQKDKVRSFNETEKSQETHVDQNVRLIVKDGFFKTPETPTYFRLYS